MSKEQKADTPPEQSLKIVGGTWVLSSVGGFLGLLAGGPPGGALGASIGGMLGGVGGYMLINDGTPAPQQSIKSSLQPERVKERDVEKAVTQKADELTKMAVNVLPATASSDEKAFHRIDLDQVDVDKIPQGNVLVNGELLKKRMAEKLSLQAEVSTLKSDMAQMKVDKQASDEKYKEISDQNKALTSNVVTLTRENEQLTTQVTTLTADNEYYKREWAIQKQINERNEARFTLIMQTLSRQNPSVESQTQTATLVRVATPPTSITSAASSTTTVNSISSVEEGASQRENYEPGFRTEWHDVSADDYNVTPPESPRSLVQNQNHNATMQPDDQKRA
jgi:hypothetical protein